MLRARSFLYSTCTQLAYEINCKYYNDTHFVWCTEAFDSIEQPGTSNPKNICNRFLKQIKDDDRHATEISNNKAGILKGAAIKRKLEIINDEQYNEIQTKVAQACFKDFFPVIYIIDMRKVRKKLKRVNPPDTASKTSIEYIIEDLKSNEFDIIKTKDILRDIIEVDGI